MKRTVDNGTEDTESKSETESRVANTPGGMSDHYVGNSTSLTVTSQEVVRQIKAVTDPLRQQLEHLSELLHELRNEQSDESHEETASFRSAKSSSCSRTRSDTARVGNLLYLNAPNKSNPTGDTYSQFEQTFRKTKYQK